MQRIALLRGGAACGKSTAFGNLRKSGKLKGWVFIDHPWLKEGLKGLKDKRELQKKALFGLMKPLMKEKKNIILEEMSAQTVRKQIGYYVRKYGYTFVVFQFEVDDGAFERNLKRVTKGDKIHKKKMTKKFVDGSHAEHRVKVDKEGIVVNTSKMGKGKVVSFILKELKK
jgi:hypothetical protein